MQWSDEGAASKETCKRNANVWQTWIISLRASRLAWRVHVLGIQCLQYALSCLTMVWWGPDCGLRTINDTHSHAHRCTQRYTHIRHDNGCIRNYRLTYPLRCSLNPMKLDSMLCDYIMLGILCCVQHTSEVYICIFRLSLNKKRDIVIIADFFRPVSVFEIVILR